MGQDAHGSVQQAPEMRRSSRGHDELRRRLTAWLADRLPTGASPEVTALEPTSANGMSSETLRVEVTWTEAGAPRSHRLVVRMAPAPEDVPVFPRYDLPAQFTTIRLVGELSRVPVPKVWWCEPDPGPLGSPFFVMGCVEGRVPPDVMPYNFGDSWLAEASPEDQRRLQDATVAAIAELHAIDRPSHRFAHLVTGTGDTPLARRLSVVEDWYRFASAGGFRSGLLERGLAWLHDHVPASPSGPVLCWGDARIGNVVYAGFEPVAVLDWEMATLGPRELDVAWLVYGHRVFEDIAAGMGLPGMPDFLRAEDVASTYESLTGRAPRDLAWYGTFAAVQFGIVFLRTGARAVRFGEAPPPADPDDLLHNREPLERMLAGTYWG